MTSRVEMDSRSPSVAAVINSGKLWTFTTSHSLDFPVFAFALIGFIISKLSPVCFYRNTAGTGLLLDHRFPGDQ